MWREIEITYAKKRVIAISTPIVDSALHDFMREQGPVRRSTRYTGYVDLYKTLTLMSELRERLSKAEARGDRLNQNFEEEKSQLKDVEPKLITADRETKTLGKNVEPRERDFNDLKSKLSEAGSKLSEDESKIKELERQLKEKRATESGSGEG